MNEQKQCPKCGSFKTAPQMEGTGVRGFLCISFGLILTFILPFIGIPLMIIGVVLLLIGIVSGVTVRKNYKCKACGYQWKED